MKSLLFLVLSFGLFCTPVIAQLRTFADDQGREIQAELVGTKGDDVVFKRNGKLAQWPIAKLSKSDQVFVSNWKKSSDRTMPKIQALIWERDGIGENGILNDDRLTDSLGKNIPILKQTEEKASYKHYDLDIHNNSPVDAANLVVSYVLYVITPNNEVVGENGRETILALGSKARETISTKGITYVRTKTTSATLTSNLLGNLQLGSATDRSKERFGGAWVKVFSPGGELLGETKQMSSQLEKLDPQWSGYTGETLLPAPESFSKLEEMFGPLKKLIEDLPKPPALPKDLPKPPAKPTFLPF